MPTRSAPCVEDQVSARGGANGRRRDERGARSRGRRSRGVGLAARRSRCRRRRSARGSRASGCIARTRGLRCQPRRARPLGSRSLARSETRPPLRSLRSGRRCSAWRRACRCAAAASGPTSGTRRRGWESSGCRLRSRGRRRRGSMLGSRSSRRRRGRVRGGRARRGGGWSSAPTRVHGTVAGQLRFSASASGCSTPQQGRRRRLADRPDDAEAARALEERST